MNLLAAARQKSGKSCKLLRNAARCIRGVDYEGVAPRLNSCAPAGQIGVIGPMADVHGGTPLRLIELIGPIAHPSGVPLGYARWQFLEAV